MAALVGGGGDGRSRGVAILSVSAVAAMSDDTVGQEPTQASDVPATEALRAWAREPAPAPVIPAPKPRGWLIPVLIAVIASAVVSVSAVLLLDEKSMAKHQAPTYANCQYYKFNDPGLHF